jgi:hypothetical protein
MFLWPPILCGLTNIVKALLAVNFMVILMTVLPHHLPGANP